MHLVAEALPGRLWIMPCPLSGVLSATVSACRAEGMDAIVSLLPFQEMVELRVSDEPTLVAAQGMAYLSHPIDDFGLPDPAEFAVLILEIARLVSIGQGVGVHCRAGIGRSGMTCAATLIALGYETEDAIAAVSRARGVSIPDTVEQRNFIANFAQMFNSGNFPSN